VDVHAAVLSVITVLGVALVVGVAAERLRVPYIVALLIVTLPLSPMQSDEHFAEAFLIVLLPTLIFEAAWNFNVAELLKTWRAVALETGTAIGPLALTGSVIAVAFGGAAIGIAAAGLAYGVVRLTLDRDDIVDAVYGVVAITILTQGLLLAPIMRWLPLTPALGAA